MSDQQEDVFGGLEDEFKNAEKAERSIGRLPESVYKVVLAAVDLEGDGKVVDHVVFKTTGGTTGFKLFMQILEPEAVGDVPVKGEIHEHVWWITTKMLPFIKRDAATILGRELASLRELQQIAWAGKTCEIGIKDDHYNGMVRSKVSFFNAWGPQQPAAAQQKAQTAGGKSEKAGPAKAAPQKAAAAKAAPKSPETAAASDADIAF